MVQALRMAVLLAALTVRAQELDEKPPPTAATMPHCSTNLVYSEHVRALVYLDSAGKKVEVRWRYSPTLPFKDENLRGFEDQSRATSYWPTAAEVIGPSTILVAGKEPRTGETCIERWTLRAPSFAVPPTGPGLRPQPDLTADVELLYSAHVSGRDIVKMMLRVRGKPSSVFVHFYDSRDLYGFDWSAPRKPMSLVLSAANEPKLSIDGWNTCWAGDHKTQGFVYVFAEFDCVPTVPALVLLDSNRDGTIDSHGMELDKFQALGLSKGDEYRELDGVCRD